MLDTSNLSAFCKGIADAIRKKKGTTEEIQYKKFDEEIESIDTNKGLVEMLENKTNYSHALVHVNNLSEVPVFKQNPNATSFYQFLSYSTFSKFPNFIDFSKATMVFNICDECGHMTGDAEVDFSNCFNLQSIFRYCSEIENVEFKNGTISATLFEKAFYLCRALKSIKGLDFSKIQDAIRLQDTFHQCGSLQTIEFFKDECVKVSFSLGDSPLLTEQSKTNIINALATVTNSPTLTLNSKVTLTDKQIETINSKGWNLAYVN